MSHVLHLDASPRGERSASRKLSSDFVKALAPEKVTYRDLGSNPPPFVTEAWVAGAFNPPETHEPAWAAAMGVSDKFVNELVAADTLVIGTPMFNLSVPATLKAWIDQVVRVGKTFTIGAGGLEGLLKGKKAVVIITSGSPLAGTPYDFEEPYLRGILGFMGITDVTFVRAQGFNDKEAKDRILAEAAARLDAIAKAN